MLGSLLNNWIDAVGNRSRQVVAPDLVKSHVHRKATMRHTAHGIVQVREANYEDSRQRRQRAADGDGPRGVAPRSRPKRQAKAELDAHRPFADADPALVGAIKAANAAQTVMRRFADQPDNPAFNAALAKLEAAQKLIRRHAGGGSAAPSNAREKEAIGPIKGANRKKPPEEPPPSGAARRGRSPKPDAPAPAVKRAAKPKPKGKDDTPAKGRKVPPPPKPSRRKASGDLAKEALKPKKIASPEYRKAKADAARAKDVASHAAKLKTQEREHAAKLARQADQHKAQLSKQAAEHQADLSRQADEHKAKLGKDAAVHQAQLGGIGEERKGRISRSNAEHQAQLAEKAAQDKIKAQGTAMAKFKNGDAVTWGKGELIARGTIIGPAAGGANQGKLLIQPEATKFNPKPKTIMMEPGEVKKDAGAKKISELSDAEMEQEISAAEKSGNTKRYYALRTAQRDRKEAAGRKAATKPTGKDAVDAIAGHFKTAAERRKATAEHHDKTRAEMAGKNDKAPGPGERGKFSIAHWNTPTKRVDGIHSPHAPGLMVYKQRKDDYAIHHVTSGAKLLDGYPTEESALRATARLGSVHPQHGQADWTKPESDIKADKAAGELARSEYKNNPPNIFGKRR